MNWRDEKAHVKSNHGLDSSTLACYPRCDENGGSGEMQRITLQVSICFVAISLLGIFSAPPAQAQMCVRYARSLTGFQIQGDAWSWWQGSVGRYAHASRPGMGSVLVFKRTGRLGYGHVAVVSGLVDRRTIRVDHSWEGSDALHRGMKVVDTSLRNDWSSVRVWHEASNTLGIHTYPTYGFILPRGSNRPAADEPELIQAVYQPDQGVEPAADLAAAPMGAPRTRTLRRVEDVVSGFRPLHKPALRTADLALVPAVARTPAETRTETVVRGEGDVSAVAPRRKPQGQILRVAAAEAQDRMLRQAMAEVRGAEPLDGAAARVPAAPATQSAAAQASAPAVMAQAAESVATEGTAVAPRHKPVLVFGKPAPATAPAGLAVATTEEIGVAPRHKPGARMTQVAESP
jgi:hypothetical protein